MLTVCQSSCQESGSVVISRNYPNSEILGLFPIVLPQSASLVLQKELGINELLLDGKKERKKILFKKQFYKSRSENRNIRSLHGAEQDSAMW